MEKRERLEAYLEAEGLDAVWFARPNSFAWLTGGSNVVDREGDTGIAAIGYERDGSTLRLVTNNVEADRLVAEELPDLEPDEVVVERDPWYESSLPEQIAARVDEDESVATDVELPGRETVTVDASRLRQPLTEADLERYRALGRETARAVESVCRELQSGDTEHEVASALRVALSARGIEAPVVLVGGGERARRYRHYTPTEAELGDYALVSVTAERAGLHASCTRTVAFDPPAWLEERHEAAARVEATALAATQMAATSGGSEAGTDTDVDVDAGTGASASAGTAGDVFAAIQAAYDAVGHDGEWEHHHQGGAAGFDGREWVATPDHEAPVTAPMAYAWNPTVQGAKSEDTVLVTDEHVEALTATGDWPTTTVEAVELERVGGIDAGDDGEGRLALEIERPGILDLGD
ncbi:Xaa-Pro aminopeptidase [Halobiforma haloterrestris]|uniref:Xaa-Pro aminopeptidase n=1 Tax=Natronobacterium haloterrestre TaxID=148448 RepID=A0A1I1IMK9_NATHA|nr:M24 family metallopeptidase [Halobiforma haloterrestris]SFC36962.1 Xaa-Pro aminopeptidase [Halobiforma haloterrestris]